jgi:hypothetical protein
MRTRTIRACAAVFVVAAQLGWLTALDGLPLVAVAQEKKPDESPAQNRPCWKAPIGFLQNARPTQARNDREQRVADAG